MNEFTDSWLCSPGTSKTVISTSMHRTDINSTEFCFLSQFCWALQHMRMDKYDSDSPLYLRHVCEAQMCLPVWQQTNDNIWTLKKYRKYCKQAICIDIAAMRNLCRAIKFREKEMVRLLFKFSMLSVDPSKPSVMGKSGMYVTEFPDHMFDPWIVVKPVGYIIEARRALGAFRKRG